MKTLPNTAFGSSYRLSFLIFCHLVAAVSVVLVSAISAAAHSPGESYFFFQANDASLTGRKEIIINDLNLALPIDDNGDGTVSTEEFEKNKDRIYAFLKPHVKFELGDSQVDMMITGHTFFEATFGTYALITFDIIKSGSVPETIEVNHTSFMEKVRPSHKVYLIIEDNARTGMRGNEGSVAHIFEGEKEAFTLSFLGEPGTKTFGRFFDLGIFLFTYGFNQFVFVITLLLPTVLVSRGPHWAPADSMTPVLGNVIKTVGVFTLAHSVALVLSGFKIIVLPSSVVEALIAFTIIAVATDSLFGPSRIAMMPIIFFAGLLHGISFGNFIRPYGVADTAIWPTLAGFNVGVQLSQIILVAVIVPTLFLLRNWRLYTSVVVRLGSILIILITVYWFAERGLRVLGSIVNRLFG